MPKRFRESPLLYIADPFRRSGETRYLSIENSHKQLPFHKEGRDASSTTALFESMLPTTTRNATSSLKIESVFRPQIATGFMKQC